MIKSRPEMAGFLHRHISVFCKITWDMDIFRKAKIPMCKTVQIGKRIIKHYVSVNQREMLY